jgi:hypothetical protein
MSRSPSRASACVLAWALLAVVAAGCGGRTEPPSGGAPAPAAGKAEAVKAEPGPAKPTAPLLKVELYVPLGPECHRKTQDLVKKYAAEHPGKIEVVILPMGNLRKDQEMKARGITCATILVGGKFEFDLPDGSGGSRHVVFSHKPNEPDSTYRSEDVIAAVEAALRK